MIVVLSIEYDGTNYSGWQKQTNANTVQQEIENAIFHIYGEKINTIASGRTDAGVHAAEQIVNFDTEKIVISEANKMCLALNSLLPKDIRVNKVWFTDLIFNARYDAIAREYKYRFSICQSVFNRFYFAYYPYKFDKDLLFNSTEIFIGEKDFTTFSKQNNSIKNYICNVSVCEWQQKNDYDFELTVKSDRFVYGMVRSIVGTMFSIARGNRTIDEVKSALLKKDRNLNSTLAPACGLILNKIYYSKTKFPFFLNS